LKESLFEPYLRQMRIQKVLPVIRQNPDCVLLDVGCGFNHKFLTTIEPFIREGYGIDFKVPEVKTGKITTRRAVLDDRLPFDDDLFDVVTMLAVLEHLSKPLEIVREIERILKPGGRLVLTVPSKLSDPLLRFLSFKLKLVSEAEIRDHKLYYDLRELQKLFGQTGLKIETHRYFQLGMNNFCVVQKPLDQKPLDQKPLDQKPLDQKPLDQKPLDQKPLDQKPLDQKPLDQKPLDQKPLDQKPLDQKPLDQKPPGAAHPPRA